MSYDACYAMTIDMEFKHVMFVWVLMALVLSVPDLSMLAWK